MVLEARPAGEENFQPITNQVLVTQPDQAVEIRAVLVGTLDGRNDPPRPMAEAELIATVEGGGDGTLAEAGGGGTLTQLPIVAGADGSVTFIWNPESNSGATVRVAYPREGPGISATVTLGPELQILPAALNPAARRLQYSAQLSVSPATPVSWSIASGDLPNGLILDPTSGAITGQPLEHGEFTFTVRASFISNLSEGVEQEYTLEVEDTKLYRGRLLSEGYTTQSPPIPSDPALGIHAWAWNYDVEVSLVVRLNGTAVGTIGPNPTFYFRVERLPICTNADGTPDRFWGQEEFLTIDRLGTLNFPEIIRLVGTVRREWVFPQASLRPDGTYECHSFITDTTVTPNTAYPLTLQPISENGEVVVYRHLDYLGRPSGDLLLVDE
jgi:hypothetical protein